MNRSVPAPFRLSMGRSRCPFAPILAKMGIMENIDLSIELCPKKRSKLTNHSKSWQLNHIFFGSELNLVRQESPIWDERGLKEWENKMGERPRDREPERGNEGRPQGRRRRSSGGAREERNSDVRRTYFQNSKV